MSEDNQAPEEAEEDTPFIADDDVVEETDPEVSEEAEEEDEVSPEQAIEDANEETSAELGRSHLERNRRRTKVDKLATFPGHKRETF